MNFQQEKMLVLVTSLAYFWTGQGEAPLALITVAQDGSGNFPNITSAILAAPKHSNVRHYIKIKEGTYVENIDIGREKPNIVFIGEGIEKTVISGSRSNASGFKTYETATVGIEGDGFMAQGITFKNTAGADKKQAVALVIKANYSTFYNCRFLGFQDTLYTKKGSQFFRECEIRGTIDFIFGNSRAIFQNCIIYLRKPLPGQYNTISAQSRESEANETGIIFQNCTVTASTELLQEPEVKSYLGRPWKNFSRTVYMQSFIDSIIDPMGWMQWEGRTNDTLYFAEYHNRGPGANTMGRVKWARVITNASEASQFTVRNFLNGAEWIPSNVPYYLDLL